MATHMEVVHGPLGASSLRDRSSPDRVPGETTIQSTRNPSMRAFIPTSYPDSSEDMPSDHSSLFNAVTSNSKATSNDSTQGSEAEKEDSRDGSATGTSPSGTHTGTRLFTITEQKSVPTLKIMPSNRTFQRRIFSAQPRISSESARG